MSHWGEIVDCFPPLEVCMSPKTRKASSQRLNGSFLWNLWVVSHLLKGLETSPCILPAQFKAAQATRQILIPPYKSGDKILAGHCGEISEVKDLALLSRSAESIWHWAKKQWQAVSLEKGCRASTPNLRIEPTLTSAHWFKECFSWCL